MSDFFALISRMRYISRWGLMRSSIPENVQEHSHMVAVIATRWASFAGTSSARTATPPRSPSPRSITTRPRY